MLKLDGQWLCMHHLSVITYMPDQLPVLPHIALSIHYLTCVTSPTNPIRASTTNPTTNPIRASTTNPPPH